ncbi:MAG: cyclopropane-fatty-acyl-phospholipid synthase family protein [Ignavibacteriaceae bacterium]
MNLSPGTIADIIQWDVTNWSRALSFWEENVDWSNVNHSLEIGGKGGGLSLWVALHGKNTICSDLSDARVNAFDLHSKYKVTDKIKYEDINAASIPYENKFDLILFKSIIGGIGRDNNKSIQSETFRQIYKALVPGGKLVFAENLTSSPLHRTLRKFNKWNYWRYITLSETREFLKDFSYVKLQTCGFSGAFGRTESQRRALGKLDSIFFDKILPSGWNYIVYGIAEK